MTGRMGLFLAGASLLLAAAFPAGASAAGSGPCGGVTAAEAASILDVLPADVVGPRIDKVMTCIYRVRDRPLITLSFNLYLAKSAAAASRDLARDKKSLAVMSPVVAVDGLGDEAYRASDPRVSRLLVRKGKAWVDIGTPRDADDQRRVAKMILAHLK